jgi:hypothetical protein
LEIKKCWSGIRHKAIESLDDQASDGRNPFSEVGDAGESSGKADLASGGRAEADNSDLVVNTSDDVAQWATRVTLINISSV